jgi:hypothetical protein
MGDSATHLIYFDFYWYLVYQDKAQWTSNRNEEFVCFVGEEDKNLQLSEVPDV